MSKKKTQKSEKIVLADGWTIAAATDDPATGDAATGTKKAATLNRNAVEPVQTKDESKQEAVASQRKNQDLIILGMFGGLFLIYGFGWIEISKAYSYVNEQTALSSGTIGAILQNFFYLIAPAAPIAWFLVALNFSKNLSTLKLALILVAGAVVLFPFPFVFAGGGA